MKNLIKICLISLFGLLIGSFWSPITAGAANEQIATGQRGLIIDCARQFYNVNSLKTLIKRVATQHGQFVQLHLTDDNRYGVESQLLKQTPKAAKKVGDTYYNRRTHLAFLSKRQLRALIVDGHQLHVEVIPEIDTPGHSQALLHLLRLSSSQHRKLAKQITGTDGELNYSKTATTKFVQQLLSEYLNLPFRDTHLGIGGDEFGASPTNRQPAAVKYTNALNKLVMHHHLQSIIWNDNVTKDSLKHLNHHIRIDYWSYDGQASNSATIKARRTVRATLPEMNAAGFQTINCNFAYLYVISNPTMFKKANVDFWRTDLRTHWTNKIWDNWDHNNLATSQNNVGSALSIWGTPNHHYYSQQQILQKTKPFLQTYFKLP